MLLAVEGFTVIPLYFFCFNLKIEFMTINPSLPVVFFQYKQFRGHLKNLHDTLFVIIAPITIKNQ